MKCPQCGFSVAYSRKAKTPEYRCRVCAFEWDEPYIGTEQNTGQTEVPYGLWQRDAALREDIWWTTNCYYVHCEKELPLKNYGWKKARINAIVGKLIMMCHGAKMDQRISKTFGRRVGLVI